MIKVINKKKEEPKVYRQPCDQCGAELEFTFDDTYEGALGARYVECPECGREIMIEALDCTKLTSKNIEFPKHFCAPSGLDIDDEEIQEWVRKCLKIAEESAEPYGYFVTAGSGNTQVILMAYADEYVIIATKDYYFTSVEKSENSSNKIITNYKI